MKPTHIAAFLLGFVLAATVPVGHAAEPQPATGFLILAPDRGHLGNRETEKLFDVFSHDYPAALAYAGRGYGGPDRTYDQYLTEALRSLQQQNVERAVVIPLFLSDRNPVVQAVRAQLPAYKTGLRLEWAKPMTESYLIAQILYDRVVALSRNPESERLVVLGMGPVDEESEKTLKADFEKMVKYVTDRIPLKETQVELYYNRSAETELRERKNEEVDRRIIDTVAKKGDALLVPFVMGPKYSHRMSLIHWMGMKFGEYDLRISADEILPHDNVLRWMKKTANAHTPVQPEHVGVIIMPHGAQKPYNDAIEQAIKPLLGKYRIELAYGMADPWTLAEAVNNLEREGVRKIVIVRMYSLADQFKDKTDYILGLSDVAPRTRSGAPPPQVRSSAVFAGFGGYEEDALICEILKDRVLEISKNPEKEQVLLIAHGARDDERDKRWLRIMQKHADYIDRQTNGAFKLIRGLTVREDWPDKHEKALKEIRALIEGGSKDGRTLIISNRLYGSGRYDEFFDGLEYEMNRKGLALHSNMTRWLDEGIRKTLHKEFSLPAESLVQKKRGSAADS
ncbi:hypothetical protein [Nitrospina watsonii]|uniref:Sirohydrochlorin cobaltochelatase n=1 Tax=Nitrospina watsonii TaxID=1323948 RepID=A0ABN8VZV5_9BACT|nr:hypothetical protein [Nitrospina watsonii]CAI2719322.1 conserved exported protein of unknown function [Nitrospina watsonii]